MAILTGICFSVLAMSFLLLAAFADPQNDAEKKMQNIFASVAAASAVLFIVLCGFWLAVLLSRL